MILHYVIHLLIYSLAVYLVNKGIWLLYIKDLKTTILFSIVVGIGNTVIKPFFIILTFPITLITLGIFLIFINGLMLMISSAFFKDIEIKGCFSAALASILISVVVYLLEFLVAI